MNIYDIKVKTIDQEEISLDQYKGKVLLIVNTATGCGFTPQYAGLEKLYQTYRDQGLEILDFPCNQFMNQAPGTDEEIAEFCQLNYDTTFQTFAKINVNGEDTHPLYRFLKEHKKGLLGSTIKWNFTKFLVGKDGEVIERLAPTIEPKDITSKIEAALQK